MTLKAAVLASGSGSNVQAMINAIEAGRLDMDIRLVLSNKPDAYVLERAEKAGLAFKAIPHAEFPDREQFDRAMVQAITEAGADTVILAGFMRMLTPYFLESFQGRVVNIHPAILPSFAGVDGGGDAYRYGVKLAGCTVHFVDEIMDHGPVIIQAAVPVNAGEGKDALMQLIHAMEHRIFPQALQWLAEGRLKLEGRVVHLEDSGRNAVTPDGNWLVWPPLEKGF